MATSSRPAHHGTPEWNERHEAYEAWRDLQDVLEERDREWWAEVELEDEGD